MIPSRATLILRQNANTPSAIVTRTNPTMMQIRMSRPFGVGMSGVGVSDGFGVACGMGLGSMTATDEVPRRPPWQTETSWDVEPLKMGETDLNRVAFTQSSQLLAIPDTMTHGLL